jgi:hypothetical protein
MKPKESPKPKSEEELQQEWREYTKESEKRVKDAGTMIGQLR